MVKEMILASASPRRAALLKQIGLSFRSIRSPYQEPPLKVEKTVGENALGKAEKVFLLYPHSLILGADTAVICDGIIMGKPRDTSDAVRMLNMLSGKEHRVLTAVALMEEGRTKVEQEETRVFFREIEQEEIDAYVASREPWDKAGGYGIQEKGAVFVKRIEGCYFNVVGLPIALLVKMLKDYNRSIW